jgi:hypothetical protein
MALGIAIIVLGIVLAYGINRSKGRTRTEKNRTDLRTLKNLSGRRRAMNAFV